MDEAEQTAMSDIEEYGCHVRHVFGEGEFPPFPYSVGIWKASHSPELIVVGLTRPIAHFVINEYNRRVRSGDRFHDGQIVSGFLQGFEYLFREVDKKHCRDYLGWNRWLYKGDEFPTFQLIWPTTEGVWPWQAEAPDGFDKWQGMLVPPRVQ